jgi:antitoxin component of MazEF toxin-antitoxin module
LRRHISFCIMLKTISKVGNSQGIIFDAALMDLAQLRIGDDVSGELHEGGIITITPLRKGPSREKISKAIKGTMKDYSGTMRRLA